MAKRSFTFDKQRAVVAGVGFRVQLLLWMVRRVSNEWKLFKILRLRYVIFSFFEINRIIVRTLKEITNYLDFHMYIA